MISNPFTALEQEMKMIQLELESLKNLLLNLSHFEQRVERLAPDTGGVALAMQVTGLARGTLYNLVSSRRIPHYKRNGRIWFCRQDLLDWIKAGKRLTVEELR